MTKYPKYYIEHYTVGVDVIIRVNNSDEYQFREVGDPRWRTIEDSYKSQYDHISDITEQEAFLELI